MTRRRTWALARLNEQHGYLSGNYAPVKEETPLTPCKVVYGSIPRELAGGQYIRNGGNPLANEDLNRESHWFDGDGMLSGVLFQRHSDGTIVPHFVNRFVVTDVLLATPQCANRPILPSIATLSGSSISHLRTIFEVLRSLVLCLLTWIPLTWSLATGKGTRRLSKISVANTNIFYHDGKALAACESGPPIRVVLPHLETSDWWTGDEGKSWAGGVGPLKIFNEMTTAHPHTDTDTKELLLYHSTFVAPYLRISVIPPRSSRRPALIGATVPGMREGKLMHDFAASRTRTVVLDLPLSLDPRNLLSGRPIVHYEPTAGTRFGIFPRREPHKVRWYSDPIACCIYHTANCWDEEQDQVNDVEEREDAVNLLACRLNSATLIYSAGNTRPPSTAMAPGGEEERCELHYWRCVSPPTARGVDPLSSPHGTDLSEKSSSLDERLTSRISHSFSLSRVPFEFPTINLSYAPAAGLGPNRFIYGCSMREGTFDAGMGRNSAKIDCLVKMDAQNLVKRGRSMVHLGKLKQGEAVDERRVPEILASQEAGQVGGDITIFPLPKGWYAQEATFVSRSSPKGEDDGFLIFFCFDETTHLHPASGQALPSAVSQLWILDARDMSTVVARIELANRVPYGLHGRWFSEEEIAAQEGVDSESIRRWALRGVPQEKRGEEEQRLKHMGRWNALARLRRLMERLA